MLPVFHDRDKCVFCRIYDNKEATEILFKDDDYAVFYDIKPAAKHHYLVITRQHIPNAKELKSEEKSIVERLVEIGKQMLAEKGGDASDARFGFHWPPFNSISHLHLHVISPASSMGTVRNIIFRENSWWFVTPEYVMSRLKPSAESSNKF